MITQTARPRAHSREGRSQNVPGVPEGVALRPLKARLHGVRATRMGHRRGGELLLGIA